MPRNRSEIARDEKVAAIVAAATRRLIDGGYAALSVADIARELGLAQAAIYWYFPTKDHLLIAAAERTTRDLLARKPGGGSVVDGLVWLTQRMHEGQHLRMAIRERARASDVVAAFHRDIVASMHGLLVAALRDTVPTDDLDDTAHAVMALCEGVLLQDLRPRQRTRVLRLGLDRLLHTGNPPAPT